MPPVDPESTRSGRQALEPSWIGIDWGTSAFRAWHVAPDGVVRDHRRSARGMNTLGPDEFEAALLDSIDGWLAGDARTPVICCGMAGARQGWIDAGYRPLPMTCDQMLTSVVAPANDVRMQVHILPGLRQDEPADVMRGEETQLAGLLAARPSFNGLCCLPGTHAKWVHIEHGAVQRFMTCMTGELYSLLCERSVLRHSLTGTDWDSQAFTDAVLDASRAPSTVYGRLFSLRAEGLLGDVVEGTGRARLSGWLIGLELATTQTMRSASAEAVTIIGDGSLAARYVDALGAIGREASALDGERLVLDGLAAAYRQLQSAARE